MKILHLTLKKKWFDMISSGEKTEEYRELKQYWKNRLGEVGNMRFYEMVEFRHGYKKDAPRMKFTVEDIYIGLGRPHWGAEWLREYFVIKLGERIF